MTATASIVFVFDTHKNGHVQNLTQELHCGICDNAQFARCVVVSAAQLKLEQFVDERNMRHLHALGLKGLPET